MLPLIVLTNCDYIEFQFGDFPAKRIELDARQHHARMPVIIDGRHVGVNELGEWGMRWLDGKITGFIDGQAVAEVGSSSGNPVPTTLESPGRRPCLAAGGKDSTVSSSARSIRSGEYCRSSTTWSASM